MATKVVLDKEGCRVRLRNLQHALEGCLVDGTTGAEIRYTLEPNRWTKVHPAVYDMLRRKFDTAREVEVPDWDPGGEGQAPVRQYRMESQQPYIIEFQDKE
jgi:hypothetical protein